MSEIYVMRHGETPGNKNKILNDQPCGGLTEEGIVQMRERAREIADLGRVTRIFTSYMWRSRHSGIVVGEELGIEPEVLLGIHERHLGLFEGMPVEQAHRLVDDADLIQGVGGISYVDGTYGSESFSQTEGRAGRAVRRAKRLLKVGERGLIIAHGDVNIAICASLAGIPMAEMVKHLHFENGGFVRIDAEGSVFRGDEPVVASAILTV